MKWKAGDILVNPKNDLFYYTILDSKKENYLIKINPTTMKTILTEREIGKDWIKYKEGDVKDAKNTVTNNTKSPKKSRRTKTNRPVRKRRPVSDNRVKSGGSSGTNGGCPQVHRKSPARRWWKRKKKTPHNTQLNDSNKDI